MKGVSIVICCFNSEDKIAETLKHVQNQKVDNGNWEVLVIDNHSTDNTSTVAKRAWDLKRNPNFRIIQESKPGLSNARLRGVNESIFDIISFVDDDNHIPENWVQFQSDTFSDENIGILGCTSIGQFDFPVPDWYEKHKLAFATGKMYDGDLSDVTKDGLVYGAGMTLRKSVYQDLLLKNWQPFLTGRIGKKQSGGEDSELTLAARLLGYRIYYTNLINTKHLISQSRLTWERLIAMTSGFGEADVFTLAYNYHYKKLSGTLSPIYTMRKYWWYNLLGKRISLLRLKIKNVFGNLSKEDFEIAQVRINSFCDTIQKHKKSFKTSFNIVGQLSSMA